MRKSSAPPHVKRVRPSRGRAEYHYFDTGQTKPNGKPILAKLPDPADKRAYGEAYAALLAHRTRRENITPVLMLNRFADLWRKSPDYRKNTPSTQRRYDLYLDQLCEAFDTAEANALEARDMVDLLDSMADRPGAANLLLAVTRALYKWGRTPGRQHVTVDPCREIKRFELGEYQPWPEWLLDQALAADDDRVKLATHLLYFTGQRIGDVCRIRWNDIRGGFLHITQEKTGKEMQIQLHEHLAALLTRSPRIGITILVSAAGGPPHQRQIREELERFAKSRGASIVPHGLRKNAVIALLEAGCSTAETAAISGQSLKMVEHYAKQRNQRRLGSAAILKWEAKS